MFRGEKINVTEDRAVLHVALRAPEGAVIEVDGENVVPGGARGAAQDGRLLRAGAFAAPWTGHTGKRVRNVVNIGIGGSDLGPHMAYDALRDFSQRDMTFRFVSNVDGTDFWEATHDLDPAETLFVISSKTFTTLETLTNARSAREWSLAGLGGDESAVAKHFVAVSTNADRGGEVRHRHRQHVRVLGLGRRPLLVRLRHRPVAHDRDRPRAVHRDARRLPLASTSTSAPRRSSRTCPCCSASSASGTTTSSAPRPRRSCPYSQYLARFPAYLQQLDMESDGKSVDLDGKPVTMQTGPIVWGQPGTNGQHAFYQLIHQGTKLIPADFIGFVHANHEVGDAPEPAHRQPARADRGARVRPGRARRASRTATSPATTRPTRSCVERLTPFTLGQLVAIYEHKVFTQGTIWNINSFDQWGVELGKQLATAIIPELEPRPTSRRSHHDSSTNALIRRYRRLRS